MGHQRAIKKALLQGLECTNLGEQKISVMPTGKLRRKHKKRKRCKVRRIRKIG